MKMLRKYGLYMKRPEYFMLITVAEFLVNGGTLKHGRDIFTSNGTDLGMVDYLNGDILYLYNKRFGKTDEMYIRVECRPLYY